MNKCSKGHFYDSSLGSCPMCEAEKRNWNFGGGAAGDDIPPTMPNMVNEGSIPPTMPIYDQEVGVTLPPVYPKDASAMKGQGPGPTLPPSEPGGMTDYIMRQRQGNMVDDYDDHTMPNPVNQVTGFDPVVGWLICIKGPNRGKDYPLHSGTNFIGRGPEMDVCIKGDDGISRKNAASISYDDRTKTFFIQKEEVRNLFYLNGKAVRGAEDIVMYDRIEIGSTELIFVPLCGEQFNWQDV